ncbi:hypothetical protein BB2000_2770 [Proteus mirabilis BB2000]|nr:hypothetical protein BB2000_2770 [Proteus mirabilis BB2000]
MILVCLIIQQTKIPRVIFEIAIFIQPKNIGVITLLKNV